MDCARLEIRQVNVATHYKSEIIAEYFKDGQDFGVDIRYVKGSAARHGRRAKPAGRIRRTSVGNQWRHINAVDFRAMLNFHREHNADLTIAVRSIRVSRALWSDRYGWRNSHGHLGKASGFGNSSTPVFTY